MPNDDSSYKFLFSIPEMVRDLVLGFIPDPWLHSLDFTTLEKVSGSYVSEDFKQREDDVVWRVKVGEDWVYLYLLIEFQSSVDKYMALRMMVYVGLLYQDLIKQGVTLENGQLPPVLPIVLYNGSAKWTAATNVAELIPTVPGLVQQFKPSLNYLLIDENRYSEAELAPLKNLVAAVFRLEHPIDQHSIKQLLLSLSEWLVDRPDIRRMLAIWIRATLMKKPNYGILLNEVNDLDEVRVMLSDKLEEWAKEYIAEGRQEGEMLALQKQLSRKFGAIPVSITEKIAKASPEQINVWLDRAFDGLSLEEIFQ